MAPKRASPLGTAMAVGSAVWVACNLAPRAFVGVSKPQARASSPVTRQNFKEDFEAWRASLTPEERDLLQEQAMGEYNKAYRKSDNFKKNIPDEKIKAFGQILSKFFENESDDYKKQQKAAVPDYDGLLKKSGDKYTLDFSLTNRVVEIDRDADRRYDFASRRIWEYEQKGEKFPQSAPVQEKWSVVNNDTESHDIALKTMEFVKKSSEDPGCDPEMKKALEEVVAMGVPPVGEDFELMVPEHMAQQLKTLNVWMMQGTVNMIEADNTSEAEWKQIVNENIPQIYAGAAKWMQDKYVEARDEVQDGANFVKAFFRSQEDRKDELKGKTKADIMKEIWAELPKVADKPVPPLDEEMLAELAEEPAINEGEFMHSWGMADVLYKSEAIDAFGEEYLLGVYETKEEAQNAFAEWNKAYEEARNVRAGEMDQWTKQEMARIEREKGPGTDRIREMLEEARR